MTLRTGWVAICVAALLASACGSGGSDESTQSTTTSAPTTTSTAKDGSATSTTEQPDDATPCGPSPEPELDVPYAEEPGVDPNLLSLDIFPLDPECGPAPMLVYVHGGGWRRGDKASGSTIPTKRALAAEHGWVFISVNYRLTDEAADEPLRYPVHPTDVGRAVAFIQQHAASYGGDPDQIVLVGHSAGAGIVSQLGAEPSFVTAAGGEPVACVVSLDTEAYDITDTIEAGSTQAAALYRSAFGDDPAVWVDASPIEQLGDGDPVPDYLLVTRGMPERIANTNEFAAAVEEAGASAEVVEATGYSHADANSKLGEPGETVITPPFVRFVDVCTA